MRRRTSPRSPAKRALAVSTDSGNATPVQPVTIPSGEENELTLGDLAGPGENDTYNGSGSNPTATAPPSEPSLTPRSALSRVEKRRSGTFGNYATVSPLKRSDGIMNLDQASRGSPSAKRRSVHAPNLATDFNIFDHEKENTFTNPSKSEIPSFQTPFQGFSPFATIPKRSSSLRRSTLQQRQGERPLFGRPKATDEGESASGTPLVVRTRMSFDSGLPEAGSDNLFSPRPGPSNSIFSNPHGTNPNAVAQPPRPSVHPLSRTITQSSSGSSLDDSPTHEPVHKFERPSRPIPIFSKSLPAGATRPAPIRRVTREDSSGSSDSFTTPDNFKLVKPLPAAFMSTGLISKKNRNAEEPQDPGFNKNMPDTPCKRPVNLFAAPPKPPPTFNQYRFGQQSEAAPSSPLNPPQSAVRPNPVPFARGTGIFGNKFEGSEISRRGSIASVDGDDVLHVQSPSSRYDSQSYDSDFPPTPTKKTFFPSRTYPPAASQIAPLERLSEKRIGAHSTPLRDPLQQSSPRTPQDQFFPPDPSGLSISVPHEQQVSQSDFGPINLPATPTGPRDSLLSSKHPSLRTSGHHTPDVESSLTSRFQQVEIVGTGEFSQVYRVSRPHGASVPAVFSLPSNDSTAMPERVWAVKKSKQPYLGLKDRERRIREVDILKSLTHSDHVISFVNSWEDCGHLYIQTEYCEEGSLDVFLAQAGLKARLDDFRIWKILLELSLGVKHIHDQGFIHLDLKPANILVTFEGVLKIGDFGMATRWPAEDGIEGEGDREYIGPEILMGHFDKPADVFSLGLIIFEIAGNVELPDNGVSWQKLRNGDMSDVPSLTWSSETSIFRDASGNPVSEAPSFEDLCASDLNAGDCSSELTSRKLTTPKPQRIERSGELINPPVFMTDAQHAQALDKIVRWMISPEPLDRPTADQILQTYGVQFVNHRRRAGATIFEGNWGPADEILAEDAEMIDV